jgi:ABC-type multidrug transport system ATPase subunit
MRSRILYSGQEIDLDKISGRPGSRIVYIKRDKSGIDFTGEDRPDADITLEWISEACTWDLENRCRTEAVRINQRDVYLGEKRRLAQTRCVIRFGNTNFHFERTPKEPAGKSRDGEFRIPSTGLIIGRATAQDTTSAGTARIDLDPEILSISSSQLEFSIQGGLYVVRSRRGKDRLNGNEGWETRTLVVGDTIQVGGYDYYTFQFRGNSLVHLGSASVLQARSLSRSVPTGRILAEVNLDLATGQFIGLLGASGQGKSTLLNALCGIVPPDSGEIRVDGVQLRNASQLAEIGIGYVPQEDIVHRELTVWEALSFAGRLRLALSTKQVQRIVESVLVILNLSEHAKKPIHVLSGGQRKRVSIASELISNPRFLFLDEPTSGLDPMAEQDLMIELAQISRNKRVGVFCTTHMLQNSHLFSSVAIIHGGRIIFNGKATDAVRFFQAGTGIQGEATSPAHSRSASGRERSGSFESIEAREEVLVSLLPVVYRHIGELARERIRQIELTRTHSGSPGKYSAAEAVALEFEENFKASHLYEEPPALLTGQAPKHSVAKGMRRPGSLRTLFILLYRQWKLLTTDPLNYLFLLAQAVGIGCLVGWVSDNLVLQMFLAVIATLWFGCSNGAQQIVAELPIFRRERLAGVGLNTYLGSKYAFQTAVTCSQALLLYLAVLCTHHYFHKEVPPTVDRYDPALDAKLFADKFFEDQAMVAKALTTPVTSSESPAEIPGELKGTDVIGNDSRVSTRFFSSEEEALTARDQYSRWNAVLRSVTAKPEEASEVAKEVARIPQSTKRLLQQNDLLFEAVRLEEISMRDGQRYLGRLVAESPAELQLKVDNGSEIHLPRSEISSRRPNWKLEVRLWKKVDTSSFELAGDPLPEEKSLPQSFTGSRGVSRVSGSAQWRNPSGLLPGSEEFKRLAVVAWFFRIRENVIGELGVKKITAPTHAEPVPHHWMVFVSYLVGLRLGALAAASMCGVALGLLVSATVRTSTQAVMWVPLIMIPQILFGGYVVTAPEMNGPVHAFSSWLPSYNIQNLMDVTNVYARTVPRMTNKTKIPNFLAIDPFDQEKIVWSEGGGQRLEEHYEKLSPVATSWQNLNVLRENVGMRLKRLGNSRLSEPQPDFVSNRADVYFAEGTVFRELRPALISIQVLGGWVFICYVGTMISLRRRAISR